MKNKSIVLIIILSLLANHLFCQLEKGRILFDNAIEVHFIKEKSLTIYKVGDKIVNSVFVDVVKKHIYNIRYENNKPVSYKLLDLAKELTEYKKISMEAILLSNEHQNMGYGILENDVKTILGYKCYKYKDLNGFSYRTHLIPSQVDIWPVFKELDGGIPLEIYNNWSKTTTTAVSMDDEVDYSLFNINFDVLKNSEISEDEKQEDIEEEVTVAPAPGYESNVELNQTDYSISKSIKHSFKNTGISILPPDNYIVDMLCDCVGREDSWSVYVEELNKGDKVFSFLHPDTINIANRFGKIEAFFAPFFNRLDYIFSDYPSKETSVYTSSTITKINNHNALIVHSISKNFNASYIVIFTDHTYALAKILYKSNLSFLKKEEIEKYFSYDDTYLSKYTETKH
ncbi:MAG: hypothetical protein IPM42_06570 [Saprospiraceae bacterium]|nr:hypothetical protein [Saprospiraceae bacterium]